MTDREELLKNALIATSAVSAIRSFLDAKDDDARGVALERMHRLAIWPVEAADAALKMPPDDFAKLDKLAHLIFGWRAASDDDRDSAVLSTYRAHVRTLIRELAGMPPDPAGRTP